MAPDWVELTSIRASGSDEMYLGVTYNGRWSGTLPTWNVTNITGLYSGILSKLIEQTFNWPLGSKQIAHIDSLAQLTVSAVRPQNKSAMLATRGPQNVRCMAMVR